jgi:hypothetical protein
VVVHHISQQRPRFFGQHCASKDYDGCDDANGFERMRVTLLEEPLRLFDGAETQKTSCMANEERAKRGVESRLFRSSS